MLLKITNNEINVVRGIIEAPVVSLTNIFCNNNSTLSSNDNQCT